MEIDKEKIARDLFISETNLDEVVMNQPALMFYWGEKWAKAKKLAESAKLHEEEVWAQRRKHWKKKLSEDDDKVTNAQVDSYVKQDSLYMEAQKDTINAQYRVDQLAIVVQALKQRKDMIQDLVKQTLSNRYGEVKQPRVSDADMREHRSRLIAEGVRKKIRLRRGGEEDD